MFRTRPLRVLKAGLVAALVVTTALTGAAGASATKTTPAAAAAPTPPPPEWPATSDWQRHVLGPSSTDVRPVSIVSTSGDITNADALIHPGHGQAATLTATPRTISSSPVTVATPSVQARYIRLNVTKLGLPAAGDPAGIYAQLAELQVFGTAPNVDLAVGKIVTSSETIEAGGWSQQYLTDGVDDTQNQSAHGWTSQPHPSTDVSGSPVWVTVDLGTVQTVDSVVLWPRTDTLSPDGHTASFPVDYSVQTSATESRQSSFTSQKPVTGQADPPVPVVKGGASIILDYGTEVGGFPTFDVAATTGSPTLQSGYSETRTQVSPTGDGVAPWASGDPQRYDTYAVSQPGRITNAEIQGGERYQEISLTTPGTVSLSAVAIQYTPYLATPDKYQGYFLSSSEELNRAWYSGAYTAAINQMPVGTTGPHWTTDQGYLDVPGTTAGTAWTDYTVTFDTKITANQAGWMVRGRDAQAGYLLILDASNDTGGSPNTLQVLSEAGSTYKTIATVTLDEPVDPGTWHAITEVVSGTTVTTSIDGIEVSRFDSATFGDIPSYSSGTFGIRQFSGEEAGYRNLTVRSAANAVLYHNALSDSSAISDFDVPGNNALPLIVDGAKRDRAVWSGDLAVEGPTLFYSTNTSEYIRGSLELLGSWAGSNGYVSGDMPPQTPVDTDPPGGTKNGYSASYSMYFVRDLAEYYQYTADTTFVRQEWPLVAKELAWSASQVDANGLFATDAGTGADWDYYDGVKTGEVTAYNALYYRTLLDGAQLSAAAGHPELAGRYTAQAAALKARINETLFNTATGLYDVSDTVKDVVAQDANVLAIAFGLAPAGEVSNILAKVKSGLWTTHGTLPFSGSYQKTISPFVSGFELNARLGAGDTNDALELLSNEWGPMLAPGDLYTGTFWENESTSGTQASDQTSMAHGWSTMPTSALSKYVLGIQPVDAGYLTWLVQPHVGNLSWTQGQAPTPHGALAVKWSNSAASQFAMHVQAPRGTSGIIAVPTFGHPIDIEVNGHKVWKNGRSVPGARSVTSATLAGDYVNLAVTAGTYDISATRAPGRR